MTRLLALLILALLTIFLARLSPSLAGADGLQGEPSLAGESLLLEGVEGSSVVF